MNQVTIDQYQDLYASAWKALCIKEKHMRCLPASNQSQGTAGGEVKAAAALKKLPERKARICRYIRRNPNKNTAEISSAIRMCPKITKQVLDSMVQDGTVENVSGNTFSKWVMITPTNTPAVERVK